MKNNISRIVYINLDKRKDRKKFMENMLKQRVKEFKKKFKIEIPYERFSAVKPISKDLYCNGKYGEYWERMKIHPIRTSRTASVLGCYLSHYNIHLKAEKENWGNYLVIEDDHSLIDNCFAKLNSFINEKIKDEEWVMIRSLWDSSPYNSKNKGTPFLKYSKLSRFATPGKFRPHRTFQGTHFQLINAEKRKHIIEYMDKEFIFNVDSVYNSPELKCFHSRFSTPKPYLAKRSDIR